MTVKVTSSTGLRAFLPPRVARSTALSFIQQQASMSEPTLARVFRYHLDFMV
ncbi:hypothetical protein ABTZ59_20890 [Streptomyces sp. NPDC094034]|uniref:hypothetical protein n=1 Tax=Streptomyces sp. NPDC094034 TaxID=3155309 RepID=UPI00332869EE